LKYLIAGLGNIGDEYAYTRHNIGFEILDTLAGVSNICFQENRYGKVAEYRFKGRTFILLKPSTYMNLSGKAVNYWLQKENIPQENLLVILDDLALPLGKIRLRSKGSDGGHNGLKNITEILSNENYARLRFGIGAEFSKGRQVDFVLSRWSKEEEAILKERIPLALDIIKGFGTMGVAQTMNLYNNK
jgi:PTH1 family peptidyl-tRNA hydrolase